MANELADGDYYILNGRSVSSGYVATTIVRRMYSKGKTDHFYTASYPEFWTYTHGGGYTDEGVLCVLNTEDKSVPVYRAWKGGKTTDHFFTTNKTEYDNAIKNGYTGEGIAFYGNSSGTGRAPIYRMIKGGDHLYTAGAIERDRLARQGWKNEGIAFYGGGVYALDVSNNGSKNLTNVQVYTMNYTDAQIWKVSTRPDGSRRITNRRNGKSLDVLGGYWSNGQHNGKYKHGQNVGIYTDNSAVNQRWQIVDSGSTLNYLGVTYPLYWIELWGNPNGETWVMELFGQDGAALPENGVNVDIDTGLNTKDRAWIFVPVEVFRPDNSIYTIRPAAASYMYLDCTGITNGANVNIQSSRGAKNQYWSIANSPAYPGKYIFINCGNNKVMDVPGDVKDMKSGSNIQIHDYDGHTEDWTITSYGHDIVDGVTADIVKISPKDNSNLAMDVSGAMAATSGRNVQVWTDNNTLNAQRWFLVPSTAAVNNAPVPDNLGLSSTVGALEGGRRAYADRLYPEWTCTEDWFDDNNHHEFRYRTRYKYIYSNNWTEWSDWTSWDTPGVTVTNGNQHFITDGLDTSYSFDDYSDMQVEMNVRCVGTVKYSGVMIHGGTADGSCYNTFVPSVTFTNAVDSYDGLKLSFTTNDITNLFNIYISQIDVNRNGNDIGTIWSGSFSGTNLRYSYQDEGVTVTIPADNFTNSVGKGDILTITYQVGNADWTQWTWRTWSGTVEGSDVGGTVNVTPTLQMYKRHVGLVIVPKMDLAKVYYGVDGKTYKLDKAADYKSDTTDGYLLPYAFRKDIWLSIKAKSTDGSQWGTYVGNVDPAGLDMTPVHSWITESGEVMCIDCRQGSKLESNINLEASSNTYILNNRDQQFVTFGSTFKNNFSIDGAIMHSDEFGHTDCTVDDILKLVGTHCLYRSPRGDIIYVAVLKAQVKDQHDYATVTIDMVQESRK